MLVFALEGIRQNSNFEALQLCRSNQRIVYGHIDSMVFQLTYQLCHSDITDIAHILFKGRAED